VANPPTLPPTSPYALAVDATSVYWAIPANGNIVKVPK
jgi:hypothetical protein